MAAKYPDTTLEITGQDGNAFVLIGRTRQALRKAGASADEIQEFTDEASSGDYFTVIDAITKWVNTK